MTEAPFPERLGSYEIVRRLAYGGMAEVLLGRLRGADSFSKYVVIKRVLPQHCANAEFVAMFRDEARLTSRLHHGNIAQVIDFGEEDGTYWLALEYVDGPSLGTTFAELRPRDERLSVPEVAHVTVEVARALDYAHRKRDEGGAPLLVVHRDVSPSNVLLSREGEVKLADFGIARARARLSPTMQGGGMLKGKLAYMAPETLHGEDADARSDLFALGAVVHEALTGKRLFGGASEAETISRVLHEQIAPPSSDNPEVPKELDALVLSLLERDPEARPARALEVIEATSPLRSGGGLEAPDRLAQRLHALFPRSDARAARETPTPSSVPKRRRVLVVDESRTMRALIKSVLRARHTVVEADSIGEALGVMRDEPPHAVLCQRTLRGRSGLDLCREMRADPELAPLPFFLLASDPTEELEEEATEAGATAVVPKSLDGLMQQLREAIVL